MPVWREIVLDGDTPVSAYAKLGRRAHSFLLESVVGGEKWAAYSFIGVGARAVVTARGGRYEVVRFDVEGGGAPARHEGALPDGDPTQAARVAARLVSPGAVAGAAALLRRRRRLARLRRRARVRAHPARAPDELGLPEACFVITDTLVIFDNLRQTVKVVANAVVDAPEPTPSAPTAPPARASTPS